MNSTRQLLLGIASHLTARRKRQLVLLSLVTAAAAFAEFVSLGAAFPLLLVLSNPDSLWNSSWMQRVAPVVGWSSTSDLLLPVAAAFASAAVATASIRLVNLWLGCQLAAAIGSDLSSEAYRRTLYQPYCVHVQRNSSTVINTLTGQVSTTVSAINLVLQTTASLLISVSLLICLLWIDWIVAFGSFALFGSAYILIGFFSRRYLLVNGQVINAARAGVFRSLQEGIGAIRDVILDGTQHLYLDVHRKSDRPMRSYSASNQFLSAFPRLALEALALVAITVLAALLSAREDQGAMVLPVIGAFALGGQRLLPAMQQTYSGWSNLKSYSADLQGLLEMLQQPLPLVESVKDRFILSSELRFVGVTFSYGNDLADVLSALSLQIDRGQRVGLIGSTGSGKSTLIDLIMGLLVPKEGQILVDGLDLNEPSHPERLLAWRSAIAHVPQAIYLADSSIAENIAFGVPKAQIDFDRVRLAAQQAQIAAFIDSLPDAYESFVGERGIRLSGGQRQRLGLARALYKQAQVLVLDEATSALDNATEQAVMDSINCLDRNLTVVMIAHRLSTVAKCDRVIRLDKGRVIADGPPAVVLPRA